MTKLPFVRSLNALRTIPEVLKLLWNAGPIELSFITFLTIVQGLAPAAAAYIAKLIVDYLASGAGPSPQFWGLIVAEFLVWTIWSISRYSNNVSQEVLRERVWQTLSLRVGQHAASLDLSFFESSASFNIIAKAKEELSYRPMLITQSLLSSAQDIVTVISFIVLVLAFEPLLALAILIALIPTFIAAKESGFVSFDAYDKTTTEGRRAAYYDDLLTSAEGAKEVRLYETAPWFLQQRRVHAETVTKAKLDAARINARNFIKADIFATSFQYLALAFVAWQAVTKTISLGDFTLLAVALSRVRQQLSYAFASLGELLEHTLFFRELSNFLGNKPKISSPLHPKPVPIQPREGLAFENVSFTYPESDSPIFENLNLFLRPNESTAIVGSNGAGKTTLVKLLLRLYDPAQGRITLDGIDIREFEPREYRRHFAVILQDFVQYQLTARENITLSRAWEECDSERLERAAKKSSAHHVISALPDGWDTFLGRQFEERSHDLSGGQWQRIALARALYREAPILILDEPTAALDAEAEAEVFRAYRDLTRGKLSLLITHRLNTVRMADRILVLNNGCITEEGTHFELMTTRGMYFSMFSAQAEAYDIHN